MIFLQPNALLILAWLLPLVLLLHLIRTRYQRRQVSSVLLWRRLERDLQAHATWRRPLWDPLLLLQLLAVVLGGLALARPSQPDSDARHLALVLDGSASMRAADVSPTRFDAARRVARDMIEKLGQNDLVSLVLAGPKPQLLASGSHRGTLLSALQAARPGDGTGDMANALALAGSLAAVQSGQRAEVVAITDGAFDLDVTALPVSARFISVGTSFENRAISEVGVRSVPRGGGVMAGYARVLNVSPNPAEVKLHVTADGLPVHSRLVTLGAGSSSELAFSVPEGTRRLSVSLAPGDLQPGDDRVDLAAPSSQPRRVLVVSDTPTLWERVLRALPEVTFQIVPPATYLTPPRDTLLILDGYAPDPLPLNDIILINPSPGTRPFMIIGELRSARVRDFDPYDPLLRGVDFSPVAASRGLVVLLPPWASAAADSEHGPMLVHGAWQGRRLVLFAFDVHASNLPQLAAFPVLMGNVVNWMTTGRTDEAHGGLLEEADVRPRYHDPIPAVREPKGGPLPERDLWPLLAALGLLAVGGEWWLYTRRG